MWLEWLMLTAMSLRRLGWDCADYADTGWPCWWQKTQICRRPILKVKWGIYKNIDNFVFQCNSPPTGNDDRTVRHNYHILNSVMFAVVDKSYKCSNIWVWLSLRIFRFHALEEPHGTPCSLFELFLHPMLVSQPLLLGVVRLFFDWMIKYWYRGQRVFSSPSVPKILSIISNCSVHNWAHSTIINQWIKSSNFLGTTPGSENEVRNNMASTNT